MNVRRYDEAIKLLASILLGTAIRDIREIVQGMKNLGASPVEAYIGVTALYLVFFRNIVGLIAYDRWFENHNKFVPPFEKSPGGVALQFLFSLFGAVVFPYSSFFYFRQTTEAAPADSVNVVVPGLLMLLSHMLYCAWNGQWCYKLWPGPDASLGAEESSALAELKGFVTRWLILDLFWFIGFLATCVGIVINKGASPMGVLCLSYGFVTFLYLISDGWLNRVFYFPVAIPTCQSAQSSSVLKANEA